MTQSPTKAADLREELLPCPGCNRAVGEPHDRFGDDAYFVECTHCGWRGPRAYNLVDAWNRWNRRAPAAGGVAEGWKVVPELPTPEMVTAADREQFNPTPGRYKDPTERALHIYRAMLAASPAPPSPAGTERVDVAYLMSIIDDAIAEGFDPDADGPLLNVIRAEVKDRALTQLKQTP